MKDKQLLAYGPTFLILKLDTDNSKDWLQPVESLNNAIQVTAYTIMKVTTLLAV